MRRSRWSCPGWRQARSQTKPGMSAAPSELHTRLCLDSLLLIRVLHGPDIANEVRLRDQPFRRMPPGNDDMEHLPSFAEYREGLLQIEVLVFQNDVELVENNHPIGRVLDHANRFGPTSARRENVGLAVLRVPCIAGTYHVKVAVRLRR